MEFIDPMAVKEKNKGDMIFWIIPIRNLIPLLLIGDIKE